MEQLLIMLMVVILLFAYSEVRSALGPSLKWELVLGGNGSGLSVPRDSQYAEGITGQNPHLQKTRTVLNPCWKMIRVSLLTTSAQLPNCCLFGQFGVLRERL